MTAVQGPTRTGTPAEADENGEADTENPDEGRDPGSRSRLDPESKSSGGE